MIKVLSGADATHSNISSLPHTVSVVAGYTTGTADIKWTSADWARYPAAIRICQDHGSDTSADVLDVENGAATFEDAVTWYPKAVENFYSGQRPGQRFPAIYLSLSNIQDLQAALKAGGITRANLWIADWTNSQSTAVSQLINASGNYPAVAIQYANAGSYDKDVFNKSWVNTVSEKTPKFDVATAPPGLWQDFMVAVGRGLDGNLWYATYSPDTGQWSEPVKM